MGNGKMVIKSLRISLYASIFSFVALAVQPAFALSSFETDATRDTASGTDSDPQGPATTGSLFSQVLVPFSDGADINFSGDGYARGAANDLGSAAVDANTVFLGGDQLFEVSGLSILTSEVTNNTGGVVPFAYDFFLPGPRLTIADFAGISDTDDPTIRAFFDFRIQLDFGSGFVNHVVSQGELKGGFVNHTIGTLGTDQLGSTFFSDSFSVFGYQFDNLDSSVTGFLADGQTVTAKTSLFVSVTGPGFETGGAARIGDPLDLSAGAFSGSLAIVPVPAAVWLFGSGLIGLIAIARRRVHS
jgi:hypothetical protein